MRMVVNKTGWAVAATLGVLLLVMVTGVVRGGALEPPGPPGPTDSVQLPGVPISSLPVTIDAPGHYYLTRNLSMSTSGNGITISASGVTLDLMGFQLSGSGSADKAIAQWDTNARYGWAIRNGTIVGWPGGGIHAPNVFETRLESLLVRDMQAFGTIAVHVGPVALIKDIIVRAAGRDTAIRTGPVARIHDCIVDYSNNESGWGIDTGDQSSIERCSVVGYGTGIRVAVASDISNCNIRLSSSSGIHLASFSSVKECTIGLGGFSTQQGIAVAGTQVVISENTITVNGNGSACIRSFGHDYYQVDGNVFVDCVSAISQFFTGTTSARVVRNKYSNASGILIPSDGDIGPFAPAESTTSPWANLYGY